MADEKNLQAIVDRLGLSAEVPPCAPTVSYGHYTLPEDFIRFCQASPSLINAISDSPYICAGLGFLSPFESPSPLEERNTDLREDGDWHEQLVSFYQGDDGDYCFFMKQTAKNQRSCMPTSGGR